ncbi:MAG: hypothetical protein RL728_741 [Bacteroidota bacterium]|jgi:Ulp1 family protease
MSLITERSIVNPGLPKVYVWNSFFYESLMGKEGKEGYNFDSVAKHTKLLGNVNALKSDER